MISKTTGNSALAKAEIPKVIIIFFIAMHLQGKKKKTVLLNVPERVVKKNCIQRGYWNLFYQSPVDRPLVHFIVFCFINVAAVNVIVLDVLLH